MRALQTFVGLLAATLLVSAALAQPPAAPPANPLALTLDSLRRDPNGVTLAAGDVAAGARTVAPGTHIAGNVATWQGPLVIRGTVDGDAVAIGGDVSIGKGGRVRGDAVSVGGTVRLDGGTVDGETRTITAMTVGPARAQVLSPLRSMRRSISLSVGWYLVLTVIALGVLLVAHPRLDAVADFVRDQPVRAFAMGIIGQLGLAPTLVLLVVGLAITVIGVVLVPFALVGYAAASAGALALGFLAVALVTGNATLGTRNGDRSFGAGLQPVLIGLSLFLILWVAGTAFGWTGAFGAALRAITALLTWIAVTAGFGAVIITRAGTRPVSPPAQLASTPTAEHEWQTPTPVTGVAAARRPTPAPRAGMGDR